jgi:hypothetical protein
MTDVTLKQAQAASYLVNTAGAYGALIALAPQLPPEILALIRAAHEDETVDLCCNAHCEGLDCCIDILLDDPARYAPEKVAEAEELLRRYREQLSALFLARVAGSARGVSGAMGTYITIVPGLVKVRPRILRRHSGAGGSGWSTGWGPFSYYRPVRRTSRTARRR